MSGFLDDMARSSAERVLAAKRQEWQEYGTQVSSWELARYLGTY